MKLTLIRDLLSGACVGWFLLFPWGQWQVGHLKKIYPDWSDGVLILSHKGQGKRFFLALLAALFSVGVGWRMSNGHELPALLITWVMLGLAWVDLETGFLPDEVTLTFLWAGLVFNSLGGFVALQEAVWGAVFGYGLLWVLYWLYWWWKKVSAMGFGDFKLLAGLGAWLGLSAIPWVLWVSSALGGAIGYYWLKRQNRSRETRIPFGPFIAVSGYGVMLWMYGG